MKQTELAQRVCEDCQNKFSGLTAKFCPRCRPLHRRSKAVKYVIDGSVIALLRERYDGRVRNRVAEIARQLGWSRFAVKSAARKCGLCTPAPTYRRAWVPSELAVIREYAGLRSAKWIGKRIDRCESAVILKMKRMDVSRRVAAGYSVREISQCFGVDHHSVDRWLKLGWLRPTMPGGGATELPCRYSDQQLRKFVQLHPLEFRLDKVDQVWFIGLILGAPIDEQSTVKASKQDSAVGQAALESRVAG